MSTPTLNLKTVSRYSIILVVFDADKKEWIQAHVCADKNDLILKQLISACTTHHKVLRVKNKISYTEV